MKIQAMCGTCGRTFLLSQIGNESDAPGRCPFCGVHFAKHYSQLLVTSVQEAERAVGEFANALGRLQGMDTGFRIDIDGLLRSVTELVGRQSPDRAAS